MESDLLVEAARDRRFPQQVEALSGQRLRACMQCGTCTGSCRFAEYMDCTPRRIIEMVRSGLRQDVLQSRAIWYCASCYTCSVRCPRGLQVTRVMAALRALALASGHVRAGDDSREFYESLRFVLRTFGRVHEPTLVAVWSLRTRLSRVLDMLPTAWRLLRHRRLALLPERLQSLGEVRRLLEAGDAVGRWDGLPAARRYVMTEVANPSPREKVRPS